LHRVAFSILPAECCFCEWTLLVYFDARWKSDYF